MHVMQPFMRAVEEAEEVLDRRSGEGQATSHMPVGMAISHSLQPLKRAPQGRRIDGLPKPACMSGTQAATRYLKPLLRMHADFLDPSTFPSKGSGKCEQAPGTRERRRDMRLAPLDAEAAQTLEPARAAQLLHALAAPRTRLRPWR